MGGELVQVGGGVGGRLVPAAGCLVGGAGGLAEAELLMLVDGSHPVYGKMGEGAAGAVQAVITVAIMAGEAIGDWFAPQTAYHAGYYLGYVVFELVVDVIVGALTAGYGLAVTKGRHLLKLDTVMGLLQKACGKLKGGGKGQGLADALDGAADGLKAGVRTTRMCFVAGTLVWAAAGLVPIEEVEAGMEVWARCEVTGEEGWRRVVQTFTTHPEELFVLGVDVDGDGLADEEYEGTGEHPFWEEGAGRFLPMRELRPGMRLSLAQGRGTAVVLGNVSKRGPPGTTFTTYNFEVEGFHTYFAGEAGVWVHNTGEAACQRMFSLFDRILDFKNYKGNLGKGYDDIVRRLGNSLDQDLKSTFVEGILEDLPRLKDAGKVDPRIVGFATEDSVFKPAEAFLGSRLELLSGRKITGRAPVRFDPVTGNQLPGADFLDELGNIWDGVGPLPKSAWATQSRLDGFYTQITRHIDVPEKGNPIIDLAGLPDSLK